MAGRQRDRGFRDRRRDNRYYDNECYDERNYDERNYDERNYDDRNYDDRSYDDRDYDRRSPYSSDEERDAYHRDSYPKDQNNYGNGPPGYGRNNYNRRYSNDRDSWPSNDNRRPPMRNERYRSRSRERSQGDRYDYENEQNDRRREQDVQPNSTIMVRNLGLQINENEIMSKLSELGLRPKEIRLMRKKDTGESRGFAFVEFNEVAEATYWRDQTQCGVVNFKRRDVCFKCSTTREESEANETGDEVSPLPTNCLLFRNLNPFTTEERILTVLGTLTALPIKSIKISKGPNACVCFVELYTTQEASQIYVLLSTLTGGFVVDDFPITVCYAKRNVPNSNGMNAGGVKNAASVALAAAQWTNQSEAAQSFAQSSGDQQPKAAAGLPSAMNPASNIQIVVPFNAPVLTNGIDYGHVTINSQTYRKYPLPNVASYVLEETSGFYYDALTCLYYDPNSHYYYNGTTQKYMYWSNDYQTYIPVESQQPQQAAASKTDKASEAAKPEAKKEVTANGSTANGSAKEEDKSKNDKVKIAKKIAKDMEKWAKTLNQKNKESASGKAPAASKSAEDTATSASSGTYNALGLGQTGISLNINNLKETVKPKLIDKNLLSEAFGDNEPVNEPPPPAKLATSKVASASTSLSTSSSLSAASLSAASLSASATAEDDRPSIQKLNLTDWNKLICLLCKRQFASREQLGKHQQASELHKTNLFKLTGVNFTQEQIAELSKNDGEFNFNYRDRAKERRQKYGQSDQPEVPSSRYKEKYMRGIKNVLQTDDQSSRYEVDTQGSSLQNSIGTKLLKNMGWSDGQGLGRSNQGRQSLIEVEKRAAGVGLGIKTMHPSGESYKDAVKRTMIERYRELHEKEMQSKMN